MDPAFDPETAALYQSTVRAFLTQIQRAVERCGDLADPTFPEYVELVERLSHAYSTFVSPHASFESEGDDDFEDDA